MANSDGSTDMHASRYHVIAALAHVDVIVRVHVLTQDFGGQVRNHFVCVHVRTRPRPGLENVDREVLVMLTVNDLQGRILDRNGEVAL